MEHCQHSLNESIHYTMHTVRWRIAGSGQRATFAGHRIAEHSVYARRLESVGRASVAEAHQARPRTVLAQEAQQRGRRTVGDQLQLRRSVGGDPRYVHSKLSNHSVRF